MTGAEGLLREGGRSEAVLVGGQDQPVRQAAEDAERPDGAGHEVEFRQAVDLLVLRLAENRAVAVDE